MWKLYFQAYHLSKKIYLQGCLKAFAAWIENHMRVVGGLFLAVLIPEVCQHFVNETHMHAHVYTKSTFEHIQGFILLYISTSVFCFQIKLYFKQLCLTYDIHTSTK